MVMAGDDTSADLESRDAAERELAPGEVSQYTGREKDAGDLLFLREWFAARRETPPSV